MAQYLFQWSSHIFLLRCLDRTAEGVSLVPEFSCSHWPTSTSFWLSHLYFLPGYWLISAYLKHNWQNTELSRTTQELIVFLWSILSSSQEPKFAFLSLLLNVHSLTSNGMYDLIQKAQSWSDWVHEGKKDLLSLRATESLVCTYTYGTSLDSVQACLGTHQVCGLLSIWPSEASLGLNTCS